MNKQCRVCNNAGWINKPCPLCGKWATNAASQTEPRQATYESATESERTVRVPEWIPVGERLPEENGLYLTCWANHPDEPSVVLFDGGWCWGNGDPMMDENRISHWMPIPPAPQDKAEEGKG